MEVETEHVHSRPPENNDFPPYHLSCDYRCNDSTHMYIDYISTSELVTIDSTSEVIDGEKIVMFVTVTL